MPAAACSSFRLPGTVRALLWDGQARGKLYGEEDQFIDEVQSTTLKCVVASLIFWFLNATLYAVLYVEVEVLKSGE